MQSFSEGIEITFRKKRESAGDKALTLKGQEGGGQRQARRGGVRATHFVFHDVFDCTEEYYEKKRFYV